MLLGENGAGKSTPDRHSLGPPAPGRGGDPDRRPTAGHRLRRDHAIELGISTVYQAVMLAPTLTVARKPGPRRALVATAAPARDRGAPGGNGRRLRPDDSSRRPHRGPVAGRTAAGRDCPPTDARQPMLILDESDLDADAAWRGGAGQLMRSLVARGIAIVFISHKLKEALDFGDRISVLRLGRKGRRDRAGAPCANWTTTPRWRRWWADVRPGRGGRDRRRARTPRARRAPPAEPPVLEVRGLSVGRPGRGRGARRRPDRGAGRDPRHPPASTATARSSWPRRSPAKRPIAAGTILLDGEPVERLDVGARRSRGLRYVTDGPTCGRARSAPFRWRPTWCSSRSAMRRSGGEDRRAPECDPPPRR